MRYGMEYEETHESMQIHRRDRKYKSHKLAVGAGKSRQHKVPTTLSSTGDVAHKKAMDNQHT